MSTDLKDVLNKAVICNESVGVIRYAGQIAELNDPEIWYGIEWLDPSRGKHDGQVKGKRYFQTKHPSGASFVRANKVDFGVDIWKAVEEKYLYTNDKNDENEILYNNFNMNDKNLQLNCVSLVNFKISSLNGLDLFAEKFPCLNELELESNLLNSWSQIFQILSGIKNLHLINVSKNVLALPEKETNISYDKIKTLVINRMNYDWKDIEVILNYFPNLVELKACFNQISRIDQVSKNISNSLKILDLESNPIKEWSHLKTLGHLKQLETLYANDVGISQISFDDCDFNSKTELFPKLKLFSLNFNQINDWNSVNELNKLKCLEEVQFKYNPLSNSDSQASIRQFFIAKIKNLKSLNRTPVNAKFEERKGAEFDYLKKFGAEWLNLTGEASDSTMSAAELEEKTTKFHREHPRYNELVKRYGAAEKSETEVKLDILKSNLISLNLKSEESGQCLVKRLPNTIDIQRLKVLLSKLFKSSNFDLGSMQLFYISNKTGNNEYYLDNNFRMLSFYAIEDGDTIIARK